MGQFFVNCFFLSLSIFFVRLMIVEVVFAFDNFNNTLSNCALSPCSPIQPSRRVGTLFQSPRMTVARN